MRDERFHVTTSLLCNNRCVFCMEGDHTRAEAQAGRSLFGWDYLDEASLKRQLEGMAGSEAPVLFTGGEPTLNPSLPALVGLARRRGCRRIALQTNGRRLAYRHYFRQLVTAGVRDFGVSIHGSGPKVHDGATRVRGSFLQSMAGLRNVLELKIRRPELELKVTTHTTLTRINLGDLPALLRLLRDSPGIDSIVLNPLVLQGNAARYARGIAPTLSEVRGAVLAALRALSWGSSNGAPRLALIDMPPCLGAGLEGILGTFEGVLYVEPDGTIDPQGPKQDFLGAKGPRCASCRKSPSCTGIAPLYPELHGWKEFVPC